MGAFAEGKDGQQYSEGPINLALRLPKNFPFFAHAMNYRDNRNSVMHFLNFLFQKYFNYFGF